MNVLGVCVCCKVAYAGRLVYLFLVRRTLPLHGYLIVWHLHLQFPYPLTLPLAAAWQISEPHSLGVIERASSVSILEVIAVFND